MTFLFTHILYPHLEHRSFAINQLTEYKSKGHNNTNSKGSTGNHLAFTRGTSGDGEVAFIQRQLSTSCKTLSG